MLPQIARATGSEPGPQKAIVFVFLRGGMDGLSLLPPHKSGSSTQTANYLVYANGRPGIRVTNSHALPGNSQFDINATCERLLALWGQQDLMFIPGAGSPNSTRSHFVQQDLIDSGNPLGGAASGGFLNRALGQIPDNLQSSRVPSAALSNGLPLSLRGSESAVAIPDLNVSLTTQGITSVLSMESRLQKMWEAVIQAEPKWVDYLLRKNGNRARKSLSVIREAAQLPASQFSPLGGKLSDNFHHYAGMSSFYNGAKLLKADPAIRFLTIDINGWDHHINLGANDGSFFNLMGRLDRALGAFAHDLQQAGLWNNVRVVVMSEFGRRVTANGASGLDHGRGGVMMVLGGGLQGKRVLQRNWNLTDLEQGDVKVTVDYRDVLAELFVKYQNIPVEKLNQIFPGYIPNFLGII